MICRFGTDHDIAGAEFRVDAPGDPGEEDVGRLELLDEQSSHHSCIHFPDPRVGEHNPFAVQDPSHEPDPLDGPFFFVREWLLQRFDFQGHRAEDGDDGRGGAGRSVSSTWPRHAVESSRKRKGRKQNHLRIGLIAARFFMTPADAGGRRLREPAYRSSSF